MERRFKITEKLEYDVEGTIKDLKNIINRIEDGDLADKGFTHWTIERSTDCPDYSVLYFEKREYESDEEYNSRRAFVLSNFCTAYFNERNKIVSAMKSQGFTASEICKGLGIPSTD